MPFVAVVPRCGFLGTITSELGCLVALRVAVVRQYPWMEPANHLGSTSPAVGHGQHGLLPPLSVLGSQLQGLPPTTPGDRHSTRALLSKHTSQGWGDVYYFCGERFQYCTCDFRWNLHGWGKAAVLWSFILSSVLGLHKLVIQLGLDGLLPGTERSCTTTTLHTHFGKQTQVRRW